MRRKYNWGILGPGKIARRFTEGLLLMNNAVLHSVGSRSKQRAEAFAAEYGYRHSYGSYDEMLRDPELDVVYIATPHSHHMEHSLLCLEAGKAVICEKAFAINAAEVKLMTNLARGKSLFLMEALWPPFQPSYRKAHEIIQSGQAGRVMSLRSFFGFRFAYDPLHRLFNPELGGGVLLDIGIYPVIDALSFIGIPDKIDAVATFAPTGVDENIDMLFTYNDGRSASLYASLKTSAGVGTDLICERGIIELRRYPDGTQTTCMRLHEEEPIIHSYKPRSRGFNFEAEEVCRCLDNSLIESSVVPLSFSESLIVTLDRIRVLAGIRYDGRD